ncbi:hypothetical protein GOP47_0022296 [Adiantum capillus-veneris]|uniref:Small ribosomal subunit protein mS38 n=1 Tax=Adiantum capillus-veneris TaxID=13818 RepID=A0A9D4UAR6_ADICA|nr:hypothetical protein GOP47_0022296 [Adiantum capillus-veneris]
MGAWRALMSRARGRTRHPFPSYSILAEIEQRRPYPFARFETLSEDACTRENERIWPALSLGVLTSQKEARQDEALLKDAKEFLQFIKKDLGRLDSGFSDYYFQASGLRNSRLQGRALGQEREHLVLSAGDSADIMNPFSHGAILLSAFDAVIRVPGFHGSKDFSIQADSVKRKRKKKMNKHKHRKLRRLARRSRK